MEDPQDRLRTDLDALAGRAYSEDGIPMFLACENLVPNNTGEELAPVLTTALNQDLALAFRRDADALQRIRPDAPVADVAKIVEVLADRQFAARRD